MNYLSWTRSASESVSFTDMRLMVTVLCPDGTLYFWNGLNLISTEYLLQIPSNDVRTDNGNDYYDFDAQPIIAALNGQPCQYGEIRGQLFVEDPLNAGQYTVDAGAPIQVTTATIDPWDYAVDGSGLSPKTSEGAYAVGTFGEARTDLYGVDLASDLFKTWANAVADHLLRRNGIDAETSSNGDTHTGRNLLGVVSLTTLEYNVALMTDGTTQVAVQSFEDPTVSITHLRIGTPTSKLPNPCGCVEGGGTSTC